MTCDFDQIINRLETDSAKGCVYDADVLPLWVADMDFAAPGEVLNALLQRVKPDLPEGIIGPTVNDEFGDVFGIVFALTGEGFSYAELKEVADEVRDELLTIPDAAKVDIYGAQQEQIFVEFDNARLAQAGLSPFQLEQILASQNIIIPGGEITTGGERIELEPSGNFKSVEELRRTVINVPGQTEVLHLQDLASLRSPALDEGWMDCPGPCDGDSELDRFLERLETWDGIVTWTALPP